MFPGQLFWGDFQQVFGRPYGLRELEETPVLLLLQEFHQRFPKKAPRGMLPYLSMESCGEA